MPDKKDIDLADAAEILKGVVIPPRPQLILDIRDVYPNIKKIADLISTDQGVSAGVLKAINSPLYGVTKKVVSIRRAVMLLGVRSVLNIVNGLLLRAALGDQKRTPTLVDYWESSVDTAIVAASVTRQIGYGSPDTAYMMGLFHNYGIPLLIKKFPEFEACIVSSYQFTAGSIIAAEEAVVETHHAAVGFMVSRYWRLPDEVCEAIRDHHDRNRLRFNSTTPSEALHLLAVLKMSENIASVYQRLGKQEIDHEWDAIKAQVFEFVGIDEARFEEIRQSALADLRDSGDHGVRLASS